MSSTAAILIIGNEVLSGKVEDTNSPFLIKGLRARGVELIEIRVLPDVMEKIVAAIQTLSGMATYVFTTGGIGPTHDDMTIAAVAEAFGRKVIRDPELERRLVQRYGQELGPARLRLADVPQGATVLLSEENPVYVIQFENLFVLPGVPFLVKRCFAHIADTLAGSQFFSKTIHLNVPETLVAAMLSTVQKDYPEVLIGSYPRLEPGPFRVQITMDGRTQEMVDTAWAALFSQLDPAWVVDMKAKHNV